MTGCGRCCEAGADRRAKRKRRHPTHFLLEVRGFNTALCGPEGSTALRCAQAIGRVRDQSELSFSATHFIGQSRKYKNSVRPFFLRQRLRRKGLMPTAQRVFLTRSSGEPASGASCFFPNQKAAVSKRFDPDFFGADPKPFRENDVLLGAHIHHLGNGAVGCCVFAPPDFFRLRLRCLPVSKRHKLQPAALVAETR